MTITIGPASTDSPITGPIEVKHGQQVIRTFGNTRDARWYATGYNTAWHAREALLAAQSNEDRQTEEDLLIVLLGERERHKAHDRIPLRMEARRIIDALDHHRRRKEP